MIKSVLAGAGLIVALAGVAVAQPQGPRITLYAGPSYQGEQRTYVAGVNSLAEVGFNDRAQSLRVQGRWRVCEASSLRGRCAEVTGDVPNLAYLGLTGSISSIEDLNRQPYLEGGPAPPESAERQYTPRQPQPVPPDTYASGDFGGPSLDGRTASFFPHPEPGPYRGADDFCRRLGFAGSIYADERGRTLRDVVCKR